MGKQLGVLVLVVAAIGLLGYSVWRERAKSRGKGKVKTSFEAMQVSQEAACDHCRAISTGVQVKMPQAHRYQVCPQCGQKKARPIVYYTCTDPGCERPLIKVKNTVYENDVKYPGDPVVCPVCGREDTVAPMPVDLSSAQKIAEETDQEFP